MYGANFSKLPVFAILCKMPSEKYPHTKLLAMPTTSGNKSIVLFVDNTSGKSKIILPKMIGMLIKKYNSVAGWSFVPQCFKNHIVVPLRDSPGKTAMPCAIPHQKAVLYGKVSKLYFCFFARLLVISNTKVRAKPTGNNNPSSADGKNIFASKPMTTVGMVAI